MHTRNRQILLPGLLCAALLVCAAPARARKAADELKCPSGGSFAVLNGKAVEKPAPVYPEEARRKGVTGVVAVFVLVDEDGRISRARACTGPRELRRPAEDAAYRARLSPTLLSGQPARTRGLLTYAFPPDEKGRAPEATPDE